MWLKGRITSSAAALKMLIKIEIFGLAFDRSASKASLALLSNSLIWLRSSSGVISSSSALRFRVCAFCDCTKTNCSSNSLFCILKLLVVTKVRAISGQVIALKIAELRVLIRMRVTSLPLARPNLSAKISTSEPFIAPNRNPSKKTDAGGLG